MNTSKIMVTDGLAKHRTLEELICFEDNTYMSPVVQEESDQHARAFIVFCLFVSEIHRSGKISKIAGKK